MNYLSECLEDFTSLKLSQSEFRAQVCPRCRNGKCDFSPWKDDIFAQRVREQPERFFNPQQADPSSSRYDHLQDFESLLRRAMQLEIADRKGDWDIPNIEVLDGKVALLPASAPDKATEEMVEEAVRSIPEEPEIPKVPVVPVMRVKKAPEKMPERGNVPFKDEGIMIGAPAPSKAKSVVDDPWATPVKDDTKRVKPGARIRFGLTGEIDD